MAASRMPTRRFLRRSPTASIAVTVDFPTSPLPDMIGTMCLICCLRANSEGARFWGGRPSPGIGGTWPGPFPGASGVRIGSSRSPCAAAPCSIVSFLLTEQPEHPKPNASKTFCAIGRSATSSLILVWGVISRVGISSRGSTPERPFDFFRHVATYLALAVALALVLHLLAESSPQAARILGGHL